MKLKHLSTLGLTSTLILGTLGVTVATSQLRAEPLTQTQQTQLIAEKDNTASSFVTVEQDHQTTGTVSMIEENGTRYLEFDQSFSTAEGPDVQVVLHRNSVVPVNLQEENYTTLAPLESFSGKQRYVIPDNVDLEEYSSVAIWCRQFNVTFAYAPLSK